MIRVYTKTLGKVKLQHYIWYTMHTCNLMMLQIIIYTVFDKESMKFT